MSRELNLVPQVYNQQKEKKKKKKSAVIGGFAIVLLLLLGFGYTKAKEIYLNMKEKSLIEEVALNKDLISKEKELTDSIARTKTHIDKAKALQGLKSQKTDLLFDELEKNFPPAVILTSLSYDKTQFNIQGTASSKDAIEELWANLRESKEFKVSYIPDIIAKDGSYTFNLDITIDMGGVDNNGSK